MDERYDPPINPTRIIVGLVVVEQGNWKTQIEDARIIGRSRSSRRLRLLYELLDRADGFGMVMYADFDHFRRQAHLAADIGQIARNDNLWSTIFVCAIHAAMNRLKSISPSGIIDLCYDRKTLKDEHAIAFHNVIWNPTEKLKAQLGSEFSIREIKEITKTEDKAIPNVLQQGTKITDYLCSSATPLIDGEKMPRIFTENASVAIENHLAIHDLFSPNFVVLTGADKTKNPQGRSLAGVASQYSPGSMITSLQK